MSHVPNLVNPSNCTLVAITKEMSMKSYKIITLCLLILIGTKNINAQSQYFQAPMVEEEGIYHIKCIAVYKNKNSEFIDTSEAVVEKVKYDKVTLYAKIQPKLESDITIEYHKIDQHKITYWKKKLDKIIEQGILTYSNKKINKDTVITFNSKTFEEIITIYHTYLPKKIEYWSETIDSGEIVSGWYKNGHKVGTWYYKDRKPYKVYKKK